MAGAKVESKVELPKTPPIAAPFKDDMSRTRHSLKEGASVGGWSSMSEQNKSIAIQYAQNRGFFIDNDGVYHASGEYYG